MNRALCLLLAVFSALLVSAAEESQSVTRDTFLAIQDIQELVEAEQHTQAKALLEQLVNNTLDIPYDNAIANQYLAHTCVMLGQPGCARTSLSKALAVDTLPVEIRKELNLFYGTVLLGEEEYEIAQGVLEEWLAAEEFPKPSQIFSLAYANYKTGNLQRAEPLLVRAVEAHKNPPDSWYQLHYRVLYEQRKYKAAERLLQGMLTREPKKKMLWRMLANHHLQLENNSDALAASMVAYLNEVMTDPDELNQLMSMFSYMEMPDKGARMLQQWLDSNQLETNAKTIRQLGNLWLIAREREPAKLALSKAASLSPNGDTYELLGGLYFEDEQWSEAYTAFQDALGTSNVKEPRRLSLLAGISAYRAGQFDEAKRALQLASESDKYRAEAKSLLKDIEEEK